MNEAAFRALVSGQTRGFWSGLTRGGLRCLSFGYLAGAWCRNKLFDWGWNRARRVSVPVVSVGNLTTGGTGKTPLVAFLVNRFRDHGLNVAILSRGYRAIAGLPNDEKLVLDLLCPLVPHLQHPDRVRSAQQAIADHGARLLVLDDGFQHRRLTRDLDLVLIDATCPWGYGALLPRGLLRESKAGLKRASLAIITRADQVAKSELEKLRAEIARHNPQLPCVEVAFVPARLINAQGESRELAAFKDQPVAAFCGIGNPEGFRQTLTGCGLAVPPEELLTFPDHHHYTASDLAFIHQRATAQRALAILTTQKDLVKIPLAALNGLPLWAVEIGVQLLAGGEHLIERVNAFLKE